MIDIDNQTNYKLQLTPLENVLSYLTDGANTIELLLSNNNTIQDINREYRNIDKATDVLSFPYEQNGFEGEVLGSIIISIDYVKKGAIDFHHSEDDELTLLFTHGLLHVLGYDHEIDSGEMREKEKEVIEYFKLPSSLIIRTENN